MVPNGAASPLVVPHPRRWGAEVISPVRSKKQKFAIKKESACADPLFIISQIGLSLALATGYGDSAGKGICDEQVEADAFFFCSVN